jgi:hypothetical protein
MTQLDLIAAQPADTPLRALLHQFDCYDLFDELEAMGLRADWQQVLLWQREGTCGDVARWAAPTKRRAA